MKICIQFLLKYHWKFPLSQNCFHNNVSYFGISLKLFGRFQINSFLITFFSDRQQQPASFSLARSGVGRTYRQNFICRNCTASATILQFFASHYIVGCQSEQKTSFSLAVLTKGSTSKKSASKIRVEASSRPHLGKPSSFKQPLSSSSIQSKSLADFKKIIRPAVCAGSIFFLDLLGRSL